MVLTIGTKEEEASLLGGAASVSQEGASVPQRSGWKPEAAHNQKVP